MQYLKLSLKFLPACFLSLITFGALAQENSPYSRIGLGNLKQHENVIFRGMGGVCIADDNALVANPSNPATYAGLKMISLQAAFESGLTTVRNQSISSRVGSNNLAYVNLGLPIGKKMGLSFGLLPITRSRYNLEKYSNINGIDSNSYTGYYGGGGLQRIYVGAAYKINDFSVGLNTGYTFGNIINTIENTFTDSLQIFGNNVTSRTTHGGFFWQAGAHYTASLSGDYKLKIGASYTGAQRLKSKRESLSQTFTGSAVLADYLYKVDSTSNLKGNTNIPSQLGVGLNFSEGDYWQVGLDINSSAWSSFKTYENPDSLANTWYVRLGGAITPDANATNAYWKKVTYRAGFYYGQDIIFLNGTNMQRLGGTVGVGLPIRRTNLSIGQVNLGLDIGSRGTVSNGLVKEGYTRFVLGFTFNDRWFIKRKYD